MRFADSLHYPPATWRLLFEPHPRPGTINMAIDEALLRSVAAQKVPPTLRLYGWAPPALSLGRGQPYADVDVLAIHRHGITLLRRMTGGTAVLNRDELTYAVAAPDKEPRFSAANIAESYRGISGALLVALERLGLTYAEASGSDSNDETRPQRAADRSPVCFEIPSDYEITVEGRKLVGSSQMRVRGGILQHGSLPLTGDIGDIAGLLTSRPDPDRVRRHALTLHDALGRTVTWEEAAEAVLTAFRDVLNLTLIPSPLTPDERKQVEHLIVEKYANHNWTTRV